MTKFMSAKFKKMPCLRCITLRIERLEEKNSVDQDEAAHNELPNQDLHCLQILPLLSLVL